MSRNGKLHFPGSVTYLLRRLNGRNRCTQHTHFKDAQLNHWRICFWIFYLQNFPKLHSGYCPSPPTLRMPAGCYLLSFSEVMEGDAVMGMGSCWLLRCLILGGVVLSSWGLQQHLDFGAPSWGGTLLPAEGEETRVAAKHLQCTGQKAQPWLL